MFGYLASLMLMRPGHVLSDASDSDAALCYCFIGFHCLVQIPRLRLVTFYGQRPEALTLLYI